MFPNFFRRYRITIQAIKPPIPIAPRAVPMLLPTIALFEKPEAGAGVAELEVVED
jgi:hypothetical protein